MISESPGRKSNDSARTFVPAATPEKALEHQRLLIAMAKDWTDVAVVRDAPERVPYVIEQLIAEIERLAALPAAPQRANR